jgi:hypothetical protein
MVAITAQNISALQNINDKTDPEREFLIILKTSERNLMRK